MQKKKCCLWLPLPWLPCNHRLNQRSLNWPPAWLKRYPAKTPCCYWHMNGTCGNSWGVTHLRHAQLRQTVQELQAGSTSKKDKYKLCDYRSNFRVSSLWNYPRNQETRELICLEIRDVGFFVDHCWSMVPRLGKSPCWLQEMIAMPAGN